MRESLYDVLEVSRTASPEVIRAAYKSLVQRFHPDKNPDNPNAENLLKLINNAYETLSDPSKRAAYDVMLALEDMAAPEAPPEQKPEEPEVHAETESDHDFAEKWDLYQAYVGKNPGHYRSAFRQFHFSGKSARTFNRSALLAGGLWAAYRKLYRISGLHFLLLAAGIVLFQFMSGPASAAAFLPYFAMTVWLAFSGDALYYRHVSRRIAELARQEGDTAAVFRKLHFEGGVNVLAPFIFAGLAAIVALATNGISNHPAKVTVVAPAPKPAGLPKPVPLPQPAPLPEPAPLPQPVLPPKVEETVPKAVPKPETRPVPVQKPRPEHKVEPKPQPEIPPPSEKQPPPVAMIAPRPPAEVSQYADFATAVSSGDRAAVEKMIRAGEDVNLVKNNQVPLIIAVKNGDVEMARLLLSHGADVNLTDSQGNTAMIYAKVRADAKMIEVLKHAGAKNPFN